MESLIKVGNKFATVDPEYYEILNKYSWCLIRRNTNFYACTSIKGKITRMHHMIIGKPINGMVTDHIDGNGLNNKKENLRIVTQRENLQNLKIKKSSKFSGVHWRKAKKKWTASLRINGRPKHIGYFVNEEDAAVAYKEAVANIV